LKLTSTILSVCILCCFLTAQTEALFDNEIDSGWTAGLLYKAGQIDGQCVNFLGGQGGWIINHQLVLGGKGYFMVNQVDMEELQNIVLGFGCGGLFLEYIIAPSKVLHFSIESMIGLGGVYNDVKDYSDDHDPIDYTGDSCFIFEPGINMALNVTENLRIATGATYRYVNGIDYDGGVKDNISGLSAQIIFQFGEF